MAVKLTEEEAAVREGVLVLRIREIINQVRSFKELAERLGCGVQTVHMVCKKHRIEIPKSKHLLLERIQEELAMNPSKERPMTERAKTVGIEYAHYYGLVQRYDIDVPNSQRPRLVELVSQLVAEGLYQSEIARKLKVTRQRVHEVIKKYGLTKPAAAPANRGGGEHNTNVKAKKRAFKLFAEGRNASEVAKICDVHYTTALKYRGEWEETTGGQANRTKDTGKSKPKATGNQATARPAAE